MKTDRIDIRIDSELKDKAKAIHLNFTEVVEQAVKEKITREDGSWMVFLVIKPYAIIRTSMGYVVGKIEDTSMNLTKLSRDNFTGEETYHPNLHQALSQLSERLLLDKLTDSCKNKPLELHELAKLIEEHHKYFVKLVWGM